MTQEVWKYHPVIGAHTFIQMPIGAKPLDARIQGGALCMWFLVDPAAEQNTRSFTVVGTGHRINAAPEQLHHIGTVLDGQFVWHIFEVI